MKNFLDECIESKQAKDFVYAINRIRHKINYYKKNYPNSKQIKYFESILNDMISYYEYVNDFLFMAQSGMIDMSIKELNQDEKLNQDYKKLFDILNLLGMHLWMFNRIEQRTLNFIRKNRREINVLTAKKIYNINIWLKDAELFEDKVPRTMRELEKSIERVKNYKPAKCLEQTLEKIKNFKKLSTGKTIGKTVSEIKIIKEKLKKLNHGTKKCTKSK